MKLVGNCRNNLRLKKGLEILVVLFLGIHVFFVASFEIRYRFLPYCSLGALGICAIFYCFLYKKLALKPIQLAYPAFAIYALIPTLFFSKDYRPWFTLVLMAVSVLLFIYVFRCISRKSIIITAVTLGILAFCAYFIWVYRSSIAQLTTLSKNRLGEYFNNQNTVGYNLLAGSLLSSFGLFFSKKWWQMVFFGISFAIIFACGCFLGSRAFMISSIVAILVFIILKFRKKPAVLFSLLGGAIVLLFASTLIPAFSVVWRRMINGFFSVFSSDSSMDMSLMTRWEWQRYSFVLSSKNFLLGYGANGFNHFSGIGTYSHSNLTEVLCNFGIVGVVLFYAPYCYAFYFCATRKKYGIWRYLIVALAAVAFLRSFFNVFYFQKTDVMCYALLVFLAFEEKHEANKNERPLRKKWRLSVDHYKI